MQVSTNTVFCLSEGFLFAIGGIDEHKTVLDSGEKYDPDSNSWSPIPPMLEVHSLFTVTALSMRFQQSISRIDMTEGGLCSRICVPLFSWILQHSISPSV